MFMAFPSIATGPCAFACVVRALFGQRKCRPSLDRLLEMVGGGGVIVTCQKDDAEVVLRGGRVAGRMKFLSGAFEIACCRKGQRQIVVSGDEIRRDVHSL